MPFFGECLILTTVVVNTVIDRFIRLGFTEYEARAYASLLTLGASTAYETAKEAGIPTSKIYEVMEKLAQRHLVSVLEQDGRKRYIPKPAEEFVENTRQQMDQTLDDLKDDLARLAGAPDPSFLWNLADQEALVARALRMIKEADRTLLVSAWAAEVDLLRSELEACIRRGVALSAVLFGGGVLEGAQTFYHPIEDTLYQEKGGRSLVLVADSREALLGTVQGDGRVDGAWSLNRGFVTLAEDYVKHDVYIMKIVSRMDGELQRRFGPGYALLRDVYSDKEA